MTRTHMDSRHLRWARTFASLIAYTQERDELRPPDLVAGIATACFERIATYWATPALLEDFVAEHCGWSEPRWLTWQRWQHELLHPPFRLHIPFTAGWFELHSFMGKRRRHFFGHVFKPSEDWTKLFALAEQLTPNHVKCEGVTLPLLTPELMLLATTKVPDISLSKSLCDSGLMIEELEKAVSHAHENPERLMF